MTKNYDNNKAMEKSTKNLEILPILDTKETIDKQRESQSWLNKDCSCIKLLLRICP